MSSAKMHSDQNGYAGIISSCAIALHARMKTPTQRDSWFLTNTPMPTNQRSNPQPTRMTPRLRSRVDAHLQNLRNCDFRPRRIVVAAHPANLPPGPAIGNRAHLYIEVGEHPIVSISRAVGLGQVTGVGAIQRPPSGDGTY